MLQESLADGDQMMFHVSGYLSAAAMLNAMQATGGKRVWDGKRVRFEHGDGLFPDLIPRAKDFGIVVVQNPTHFDVGLLFGPTPMTYKEVQPFRSLLAAGIPVALGSDGPINPYLNIMLATGRSGPTHRGDHPRTGCDRLHADIRLRRIRGERQRQPPARQARRLGRALADIFQVPAADLPKTESVLTIVGGKIVFDSGALVPSRRRRFTRTAEPPSDPRASPAARECNTRPTQRASAAPPPPRT